METNEPAKPMILRAIVGITAALAKAGISKDRRNQQQGYSFRGVEDVYAALSPLLAEHNVAVLPRVVQRIESVREAKSGGSLYSVVVEVHYRLQSALDGSHVEVSIWGEAMDSADKATNKAMSAAYKYMAFQTFCIPIEGHEDADNDTPPPSRPAVAGKPAATQAAKASPAVPTGDLTAVLQAIAKAKTDEDLTAIVTAVKTLTAAEQARVRPAFKERRDRLAAQRKIQTAWDDKTRRQGLIDHCGTLGIVLDRPDALDPADLTAIAAWLGEPAEAK